MPVYEDEHGTYIMNSKDLRAVQHVARLTQMGVASLKIEGRTKSHYYVARTAQVYRQAIDDAVAGRPFNKRLMDELENLANRGYTEGFYQRHVHGEFQRYEQGHSIGVHQQFVGEVLGFDPTRGTLEVEVKNRFEVGMAWSLCCQVAITASCSSISRAYKAKRKTQRLARDIAYESPPQISITPEQLEFALLMRDLTPSKAEPPESLGVAIS